MDGEKARRELRKKSTSCFEPIPEAILHKKQLYGHINPAPKYFSLPPNKLDLEQSQMTQRSDYSGG